MEALLLGKENNEFINQRDDDDDDDDSIIALSDEPKYSSASLCMKFNFCGNGGGDNGSTVITKSQSRPVYTHQIFQNEYIPGYQPFTNILNEAKDEYYKNMSKLKKLTTTQDDEEQEKAQSQSEQQRKVDGGLLLLHKSHQHHHNNHHDAVKNNNKELLLSITLAPSCRKCFVECNIQNINMSSMNMISNGSNNKKRKDQPDDDATKDGSSLVKRIKGGGGSLADDTISNSTSLLGQHQQQAPTTTNNGGTTIASATVVNKRKDGTTTSTMMSTNEILKCLNIALPQIICVKDDGNDDLESVQNDYLNQPIGKIIHEYSIHNNNETMATSKKTKLDFCLCLADARSSDGDGIDDPTTIETYHNQVQNLALFYIETAESVDITNTQSSGYWKVLYLFQKHTITNNKIGSSESDEKKECKSFKYSLAGFMTLFHFNAPFHKPTPGTIIRICQALILPPYQRQGHGKRMMHCVYDNIVMAAHRDHENQNKEENIVLVNVEDPAPGFVALRDKVDIEYMLNYYARVLTKPELISLSANSSDNANDRRPCTMEVRLDEFFVPLKFDDAKKLSNIGKIIPRQIHIAYELYRLKILREYIDTGNVKQHPVADGEIRFNLGIVNQNDDIIANLEKKYRLIVKKRLNKEHREELQHSTIPELKDFLAKRFDEVLTHYEKVLCLTPRMQMRG